MPVPWKKSKSSKVFGDRMNSSKNGGSLVVETGFPTSIVDLFHKHRDKIMKKSLNKKQSQEILPPVGAPSSSVIMNNLMNSSDSDSTTGNSRKGPKKLVKTLKLPKKLVNQESIKSDNAEKCRTSSVNQEKNLSKLGNADKGSMKMENPVANLEESSPGMVNTVVTRRRVFLAFFKVSFVVILAMGTNRLVVGVSVSALSLFFLEYLGKYLYGLLKPRLNSTRMGKSFKSMGSRKMEGSVTGSVRNEGDEKLEDEGVATDCCASVKGENLNDPSNEKPKPIVRAESNLDSMAAESSNVDCDKGLKTDEADSNKGVFGKEEDGGSIKLMDPKCKGSRRAKVKSKLKKLVSKKILRPKRKSSDSKSEEPYSTEEDIQEKERGKEIEQPECSCEEIEQSRCCGETSEQSKCRGEEFEQSKCRAELSDDGTEFLSDVNSDSFEGSKSDTEPSVTNVIVEKLGRKTEGTLKYCVLCVIVLGGLVGGRSLAVVLTLICCLMWIIHKILYKASHGERSSEKSC